MTLWTCTIEANVATAVYRYPPMNYFCADGAAELGALIETWREPAIKAVVLAGGMPGRFITHYSVEELLSYAEDRTAMRQAATALHTVYLALLTVLRNT